MRVTFENLIMVTVVRTDQACWAHRASVVHLILLLDFSRSDCLENQVTTSFSFHFFRSQIQHLQSLPH